MLERGDGVDVTRVAVDTTRGGMLVEASLNGVNVVNAHDTGRGVQIALYDGAHSYDACAGCSGSWGWNPVQGGDRYNRGSGVLWTRLEAEAVVVAVRPLQWLLPDSADAPAQSDVVIEQRVSPVAGDLRAFRVDYRVELEGTASRRAAMQELPAAYAGAQYRRLVTYSGPSPWTGGEASATALPPLGLPPAHLASPERWFALVDDNDTGLTIFAPGAAASVRGFAASGSGGPMGAGTSFARLDAPVALPGGQVLEGHYYVMVGNYARARQTIERLRE